MPRIPRHREFVPLAEFCRRTGMGRDTARKRVQEGELGDYLYDPKAGTFVQRSAIDKWMADRLIQARRNADGSIHHVLPGEIRAAKRAVRKAAAISAHA